MWYCAVNQLAFCHHGLTVPRYQHILQDSFNARCGSQPPSDLYRMAFNQLQNDFYSKIAFIYSGIPLPSGSTQRRTYIRVLITARVIIIIRLPFLV